jgi:hypothetical protein
MGLFWKKYARRIFAIVSTTSIPDLAPASPTEATVDPLSRRSRLNADHPENGPYSMPMHIAFRSFTEEQLSTENEPVRNILLATLSSLAKLEREKISQRTKAASSERARRPRPSADRNSAMVIGISLSLRSIAVRAGSPSARRLESHTARSRSTRERSATSRSNASLPRRRAKNQDGWGLNPLRLNFERPCLAESGDAGDCEIDFRFCGSCSRAQPLVTAGAIR